MEMGLDERRVKLITAPSMLTARRAKFLRAGKQLPGSPLSCPACLLESSTVFPALSPARPSATAPAHCTYPALELCFPDFSCHKS